MLPVPIKAVVNQDFGLFKGYFTSYEFIKTSSHIIPLQLLCNTVRVIKYVYVVMVYLLYFRDEKLTLIITGLTSIIHYVVSQTKTVLFSSQLHTFLHELTNVLAHQFFCLKNNVDRVR